MAKRIAPWEQALIDSLCKDIEKWTPASFGHKHECGVYLWHNANRIRIVQPDDIELSAAAKVKVREALRHRAAVLVCRRLKGQMD